jgi:hypothetical protein
MGGADLFGVSCLPFWEGLPAHQTLRVVSVCALIAVCGFWVRGYGLFLGEGISMRVSCCEGWYFAVVHGELDIAFADTIIGILSPSLQPKYLILTNFCLKYHPIQSASTMSIKNLFALFIVGFTGLVAAQVADGPRATITNVAQVRPPKPQFPLRKNLTILAVITRPLWPIIIHYPPNSPTGILIRNISATNRSAFFGL